MGVEDLLAPGGAPGPRALSDALKDAFRVETCLKTGDRRRTLLLTSCTGNARHVLKTAPSGDLSALMREYKLLLRLHDGAFPHPIACFPDGERAFFLREYVPGVTLAELVEAEGAMDARRAADIAVRVSAAVGMLESLEPPVVHGDITPHGVVLCEDGAVCLIDLGSAEERAEAPRCAAPAMAPERLGYRYCDERTDVYAIGMLTVYLITGGYDAAALRGRSVPRSLRRIILSCLEFDPKRRQCSPKRLGALLSAWRRPRRKRAIPIVAALAALILLGLGGSTLQRFFDSAATVAREPAYEFASPLIEKAVRLQLGKDRGAVTQGDLRRVTQLCLCAETPYSDWFDLGSYGTDQMLYGENQTGYAHLDDLSDLENMPNLRRLALNRLGIREISRICDLPLTHLALGGNEIRDIAPLTRMPALTFLDISNNPIYALDGLEKCASLGWLNISALPVLNISALTGLRLDTLLMYDMPPDFDALALQRLEGLKRFGTRKLPRAALDALAVRQDLEDVWFFEYPAADLSPFLGMGQLADLMASCGALENLEGVSSLEKLETLIIDSNPSLTSIEPLRGNAAVKRLKISHDPLTDLSVLMTMPNLKELTCSQDQMPLVDALPGGRAFTVTIED